MHPEVIRINNESLDNLTPADVNFGRKQERLSVREMIKHETLRMRRAYNFGKGGLKNQLHLVITTPYLLTKIVQIILKTYN